MNIQIIDRLLSILGNKEESTVGENGLNTIDELLRNLLGKKFKQLRKVLDPY